MSIQLMIMDNQTTKKCISRILAGNRGTFEQLIEANQRLVVHILQRLVYSPSDIEDLAQDVFLKVYQGLAGFRYQSSLSTWIGRIAYHTGLNYLEKKKTLRYDDLPHEYGNYEAEIIGDELLPLEQVEKSDITLHLQKTVQELSPVYRTVLTLYHWHQMSYQEISEITQMPVGTVKNYLFRARRQLKKKLLAQYQQEELC
ncbi:RNA polymerase sigma factor [bacterium]|nr:RNA polymerase sigma factor [bacterium]